MAELRKDIPVTYEFEDYIPPEEDGVIFEPQDDSRMVMAERSSGEPFNPPDSWYTAEPDVAYTLGVEDKEKREAFLKSMPDPNLGRPRVSTGRPAVKKNLSRRTMSDVAVTSSDVVRSLDYKVFCGAFFQKSSLMNSFILFRASVMCSTEYA